MKTKLTPKQILEEVKKRINFENFNMYTWHKRKGVLGDIEVKTKSDVKELQECGTVHCIAGWIELIGLENGMLKAKDLIKYSNVVDANVTEENANILLGFPANYDNDLFFAGCWYKIDKKFDGCPATIGFAKSVIDVFIEKHKLN
jgi:hypothetical protein